MIITIKNDEGVTTNFDINLISDEQKKQEATVHNQTQMSILRTFRVGGNLHL